MRRCNVVRVLAVWLLLTSVAVAQEPVSYRLTFPAPEHHWMQVEATFSGLPEGPLQLNEVEKTTILRVIERNNGNITKAAKELGITRTALYRRLEKHDI